MNEYVYRIWDKVEECYWSHLSSRLVYDSASSAKAMWTNCVNWEEKYAHKHSGDKRPFFDTQDRYVVHRFKVSFEFAEEVR